MAVEWSSSEGDALDELDRCSADFASGCCLCFPWWPPSSPNDWRLPRGGGGGGRHVAGDHECATGPSALPSPSTSSDVAQAWMASRAGTGALR